MKKQLDPTLSVRVPQHLIDAIEKEAAARGLPRADYLRAALRSIAIMGSAVIFDYADIPPMLREEYMGRTCASADRRRHFVDVLYPPAPPLSTSLTAGGPCIRSNKPKERISE